MLQRQVGLESGFAGCDVSAKNPVKSQHHRNSEGNLLVCVGDLVLYGTIIIRSSAVRASAFFAMGFDIIIAELADLNFVSIPSLHHPFFVVLSG